MLQCKARTGAGADTALPCREPEAACKASARAAVLADVKREPSCQPQAEQPPAAAAEPPVHGEPGTSALPAEAAACLPDSEQAGTSCPLPQARSEPRQEASQPASEHPGSQQPGPGCLLPHAQPETGGEAPQPVSEQQPSSSESQPLPVPRIPRRVAPVLASSSSEPSSQAGVPFCMQPISTPVSAWQAWNACAGRQPLRAQLTGRSDKFSLCQHASCLCQGGSCTPA